MKQIFSLYETTQAVSGMMTAGPLFYYTLVAFRQAEYIVSGVTLVLAIAAFFLPGYLMNKYIEYIGSAKKSFKEKILSYIPFY